MVAGMLGAIVGWALIEPVFEDGIRFQGRAEQVRQLDGPHPAAQLHVGGLTVYVPSRARLRSSAGPAQLADLRDGLRVDVRGETDHESRAIVAYEVRIEGPAGPATAIDLRTLGMRKRLIGYLVFPLLAALVGLFVGAADGLLSRALRRSAVCGLVGLAIGLSAGLVASLLAELMYAA